jgi:hypothetical protein
MHPSPLSLPLIDCCYTSGGRVQILVKNTGPDTHEISSKASLILKRVEGRLSMVEEDVGEL